MRQNKVKEEVLLSKVPPHSQEVEKSVIGLFLLEPSCITENINHLSEEFFYVRSHQIIFQAIQDEELNRKIQAKFGKLKERREGHLSSK